MAGTKSWIEATTHSEHGELIGVCARLAAALSSLRVDIGRVPTRSHWAQDFDFLDWVDCQGKTIDAIVSLVLDGHYRESYHTARLLLESYLLLRVVWTCSLYRLPVRVTPKAGELIDDARARLMTEAKSRLGRSLVNVEEPPRAQEVVLVLRGRRIVDSDGNDTGRYLPNYWHAWQVYRPRHFVTHPKYNSSTFLLPEWAVFRGRRKANRLALDRRDRELYRSMFSFDRLLQTLMLNKVLNKKTALRTVVHYNFLSGFTHSTKDAFKMLIGRAGGGSRPLDLTYDHYHSEMSLLYAAHLGALHLDAARKYFEKTEIGLRFWSQQHQDLADEVSGTFDYFWFIFNGPHEFDRYQHANRRSDFRAGKIVRPSEVRPSLCRYFDDPLARLKGLHGTTQEFTTGNTYVSPFPRNDWL